MQDDTPNVDFLLPGSWWRIPLDSEQAVRTKAKRLAEEALGKADERATKRRELAQMLISAAQDAKAMGGQDFYFATEIVPGGRIPISLSVSWPQMPETLSMHAGPGAAAVAFAARTSRSWASANIEVLDSESGVVRSVEQRVILDPHKDGEEVPGLSKVTISYWFFGPMHDRALMMSFTSPLVDETESLVTLCDAIASSVTWVKDVQEEPVDLVP